MSDNQTTPRAIMSPGERRVAETEKELADLMQPLQTTEEVAKEEVVVQEDDNLSAEEKSFKKRYGDLRRHQQLKEKELQAKIDALEGQLRDAPTANLPKIEEDVNAWVEKYPDVAAIVENLADKKAKQRVNERDTEYDTRLKQVEEMRDNLTKEKAEAELMRLHPDFDEIRNADAFHDWAELQPKWVQNALYEDDDVVSTARAIDLYKMDKGIKKTSPDKNAAMSVNTRNRVTPQDDESSSWFSESQVKKMSDKEFTANLEAIEKAQRDGRFRYDLSQKAR